MNQAVHGLIKLKVPLSAAKVHGALELGRSHQQAAAMPTSHTCKWRLSVCVWRRTHSKGTKPSEKLCLWVLSSSRSTEKWIFTLFSHLFIGCVHKLWHFAGFRFPFRTKTLWFDLFVDTPNWQLTSLNVCVWPSFRRPAVSDVGCSCFDSAGSCV